MPPTVQRKAAISSANDPFEREADEVADKVIRMAEQAPIGSAPAAIQRKCTQCDDNENRKIQVKRASVADSTPAPAIEDDMTGAVDTLSRGSEGSSLPPTERAFFETRFGIDFGDVRIHAGSRGNAAARAIGARAFTRGTDIAFGPEQYAPGTDHGRRLLAHELVHVLQQRGLARSGADAPVQRQTMQDEEIRRRIAEIEAELNAPVSRLPEEVERLNRERNRLAAELNAPVSVASTPAADEDTTGAVPSSVPVGLTYELFGAPAGSSGPPPAVTSALEALTTGGGLAALSPGAAPRQDSSAATALGFAPALPAAGGVSLLQFLNPMPGTGAIGDPNVFTRFAGPETIDQFFEPGRFNLNSDLRPRLFQGSGGTDAGEFAFQQFRRGGISFADLSRISRQLRAGGIASLSAEDATLFQRITQIHAEIHGATPSSPLISLTELSPEEALGRLPPTGTNRTYVVRVRINPQDVGRVNEILRRAGSATEGLAGELEVVVAQDLAPRLGSPAATRIVSITRNVAPHAPLGGAAGTALTWAGRGMVFLGAALTVHQIVTASGPHRRETEGRAFGSFAGATVLGALGAGFCVGAGIATGGAALLLCGLAFGAVGGLGGGAAGGAIGSVFDE